MLQRISHFFASAVCIVCIIMFLGSGYVCRYLGIFSETKTLRFIIFFIGVFFTNLLVEYFWSLYATKKINKLRPLLFRNGGNPHLYIKEINQLIKDTTNTYVHTLCYVNLAAAYNMLGDYRAAKEHLYKVNTKLLKEPVLTNYWIAYIGHHFESGEYDFAIQCMNEHAAQLHRYRTHPELGGYIVTLELFRKLALNQTEGLMQELEAARRNWPGEAFVDDFDLLAKRIMEKA